MRDWWRFWMLAAIVVMLAGSVLTSSGIPLVWMLARLVAVLTLVSLSIEAMADDRFSLEILLDIVIFLVLFLTW